MSYAKGADRERQVADVLREDGWVVVRSAGSHGLFDLAAFRNGCIRLIEVKATSSPFDGFPPAQRAALLDLATQAGAVAELAHWPAHGQLRFLDRLDWPGEL